MVTHVGVQLVEQLRHFERFRVQGTPCTAHVVADVFAETDGCGAALFRGVQVAGLDEAAADGDDGGWLPVFLHFARFPEKFEDPLLEWSAHSSKIQPEKSGRQTPLLLNMPGRVGNASKT